MKQGFYRQNSCFCIGVWILLASVVLPGCGGGGDGGGSSRNGARILHASIDSAPFDLRSSSKPDEVLETSKFFEPAGYRGLPGGEQALSATGVLGAPAFAFSIGADRPARQTILVFGSRSASGTRSALFADDAGQIADGMSAMRLMHGVDKTGELGGAAGGVSLGRVSFGQASDYVQVPSGTQEVVVKSSADGRELFRGVEILEPSKAYTVLVAGEAGYLIVTRLVED